MRQVVALPEQVLQLPSQDPQIRFGVSAQVPSGQVETHVDELKIFGEEQPVQVVEEVTHFWHGESQFLQVLSLVSANVPSGQASMQVDPLKNLGLEQLVQVLAVPKQVVQGESQFLQVLSLESPCRKI